MCAAPAHASTSPTRIANKSVELATTPQPPGDIAEWGRTGVNEPVELSENGDEHRSMSSGLEPRDQAWGAAHLGGPRARPFAPDAGLSSLVHHTQKYVEAQTLRKYAPPSAPGIVRRCCLRH